MTTKDLWSDPLNFDPLTDGPPYLRIHGVTAAPARLASEPQGSVRGCRSVVVPTLDRQNLRSFAQRRASVDAERQQFQAVLDATYGPTPYRELGALVGVLRGSALVHQTHHWRTHGPTYYADHLLFERVYTMVNDHIDAVAERAVGLGGPDLVAPHALVAIEMGLVAATYQGVDNAHDPSGFAACSLRTALRGLVVTQMVYDVVKKQDRMTPGLDNMLQGVCDTHEQVVYLLKQRCAVA